MEGQYMTIPSSTSSTPSLLVDHVTTPVTISTEPEPIYSTVVPRSQRRDHSPQQMNIQQSVTPTSAPNAPPVPPRAHSTSSQDINTIQLRVHYLEGIVTRLNKEKKAMEEEFGRQRKKFMNQMIESESESNLMKQSLSKHVGQIEGLNKSLLEKEEEIKRLKNEGFSQEKYDRLKYEETIASLKNMIQVSSHEHQVEIERLRAEWSKEKKQLMEKKQFNSKSNLEPESAQYGRKSPTHQPETTALESLPTLNFTSELSLENSMIRAAEDAKLLKSVVVPLEEEIDMLKIQLKEAQERLQIYEGKDNDDFLSLGVSLEPLIPSPSRSPVLRQDGDRSPVLGRGVSPLLKLDGESVPVQLKQDEVGVSTQDITETEILEKLLKQERAARHDLEMHIQGLRRQKTVLLGEVDEFKEQIAQVQKNLENEQKSHKELKIIWERANVQFISSQDQLRHQLEELQEEKKQKLQSMGAYSPRPPSSPVLHSSQIHFKPTDLVKRDQRRRAISWSEGDRHEEFRQDNEIETWKATTEHLQRLVSEQHHELQNKTAACDIYEKQLERVQHQLMTELEDKDTEIFKMREEVKKVQAALLRERKTREEFRRQLASTKEDMKTKVENYLSLENKVKLKHKNLKDKFTETRHDVQKQTAQFMEERTHLHNLVDQKREEYDCLKQLQTNEIMSYREKLAQIEQARSEAEMNVASTVDELTKVREGSVQLETKLSGEVSDLQQLVSHTRLKKESLEEELSKSLSEATELRRVNALLERERHDTILSRTALQEKSKQFIEEQQRQINQLLDEKTELSKINDDFKRQITLFKQQLQNSESVQKDFVELSQTLQVRLVEMEEAETRRKDSSDEQSLTKSTSSNLSYD